MQSLVWLLLFAMVMKFCAVNFFLCWKVQKTLLSAYSVVSSLTSDFKVCVFLRYLYTSLITYALVILRTNITTYFFISFGPKGMGEVEILNLGTSGSQGAV